MSQASESAIQAALVVFGVGAVWLTQTKSEYWRRWAPVVGLLGQPFWYLAAWGQPGMLAVVTLYTAVWIKGVWSFWLCRDCASPAKQP